MGEVVQEARRARATGMLLEAPERTVRAVRPGYPRPVPEPRPNGEKMSLHLLLSSELAEALITKWKLWWW